MNEPKVNMSYSVGPNPNGEGSSIVVCNDTGGVITINLGEKETLLLIDLLQTVIGEENGR